MPTMTVLKELEVRISDIEAETNGDLSKFNVTSFEQKIYASLKKMKHGSWKQLKFLEAIEIKVFGQSRELREIIY
jgi:hypothetical protein